MGQNLTTTKNVESKAKRDSINKNAMYNKRVIKTLVKA